MCVEQSKPDIKVRNCCKCLGKSRENVDYGEKGGIGGRFKQNRKL